MRGILAGIVRGVVTVAIVAVVAVGLGPCLRRTLGPGRTEDTLKRNNRPLPGAADRPELPAEIGRGVRVEGEPRPRRTRPRWWDDRTMGPWRGGAPGEAGRP